MIQKNKCLILLLILLCGGCYNKTSNFIPSFYYPQCMEDFIDTRIVFVNQGGNFILDNIIPFIPIVKLSFGYKTTRMQVQMTIRNGYEDIKWTVFGEGTDREFNWGTQAEIPKIAVPIGYAHRSRYLDSISKLARKTIRDGFEKLKEIKDGNEPWSIIIKEISDEGKINILFGSSNGLKEGDFFAYLL